MLRCMYITTHIHTPIVYQISIIWTPRNSLDFWKAARQIMAAKLVETTPCCFVQYGPPSTATPQTLSRYQVSSYSVLLQGDHQRILTVVCFCFLVFRWHFAPMETLDQTRYRGPRSHETATRINCTSPSLCTEYLLHDRNIARELQQSDD